MSSASLRDFVFFLSVTATTENVLLFAFPSLLVHAISIGVLDFARGLLLYIIVALFSTIALGECEEVLGKYGCKTISCVI